MLFKGHKRRVVETPDTTFDLKLPRYTIDLRESETVHGILVETEHGCKRIEIVIHRYLLKVEVETTYYVRDREGVIDIGSTNRDYILGLSIYESCEKAYYSAVSITMKRLADLSSTKPSSPPDLLESAFPPPPVKWGKLPTSNKYGLIMKDPNE